MLFLNVLAGFREKLLSNNIDDQYAALLYALQLPGICARIEFPPAVENVQGDACTIGPLYKYTDKKNKDLRSCSAFDRALYLYWFNQHRGLFLRWFDGSISLEEFSEKIYDLRNSLTHEGRVLKGTSRVLFGPDRRCIKTYGSFMVINLIDFCESIFGVAELVFFKCFGCVSEFNTIVLDNKELSVLDSYVKSVYSSFWAGRDTYLELYQNWCHCFCDLFIKKSDFCDLISQVKLFFDVFPDGVYPISDGFTPCTEFLFSKEEFYRGLGLFLDIERVSEDMGINIADCLGSGKSFDVLLGDVSCDKE